MVEDLLPIVYQISNFLGKEQDLGLFEKIMENSRFESMKENPARFLGSYGHV